MPQNIPYTIRFSFPSADTARERMLPAVDLYLRALEDIDRLAAGALGLELDYHRELQEMGGREFCYSVSASFRLPAQTLLGSWPQPEVLRSWINRVREDIRRVSEAGEAEGAGEVGDGGEAEGTGEAGEVGEAGGGGADAAVRRWDAWAKESGLGDFLLYSPPKAADAACISGDMGRALEELGGPSAVTLITG